MKMDDDYFREEIIPIMVLTIVVCISVIILSIVDSLTADTIEEVKQNVIDDMLEDQFPELEDSEYNGDNGVYSILVNDTVVGYAFMIEANGYGGPIEILVGIEGNELTETNIILRGISIIYHLETPGLGAKITETPFLEQFEGINLNDVLLKDDDGDIDAISGATISSTAVVDAIQEEVGSKVRDILALREEGV